MKVLSTALFTAALLYGQSAVTFDTTFKATTWVNQGAAVITGNKIVLPKNESGAEQWRLRVGPIEDISATVEAAGAANGGLVFRDSATGRLLACWTRCDGGQIEARLDVFMSPSVFYISRGTIKTNAACAFKTALRMERAGGPVLCSFSGPDSKVVLIDNSPSSYDEAGFGAFAK